MGKTPSEQVAQYNYRLDVSWIHHDSALEGLVYEPHELVAAIDRAVVSDSALVPVYDEIRQYKAAIDHARALAGAKSLSVGLDTLKAFYERLAPDAGDGYRADMPLHRLYFHEIAQPNQIPGMMKALQKQFAAEATRRHMHPVRYASRIHYDILQVFPYPKHSGKIARLVMNAILMHEGYPPAILHATDRQSYYDGLRQGVDAVAAVIQSALLNAVNSGLRYFHQLHGIEDTNP